MSDVKRLDSELRETRTLRVEYHRLPDHVTEEEVTVRTVRPTCDPMTPAFRLPRAAT